MRIMAEKKARKQLNKPEKKNKKINYQKEKE